MVSLIVGPALISADLRNNGLPLYLARPFSRTEYILGKSAVLIILLSAVTWIPGMFLFLFQSYMAGFEWFGEHYRIGFAILLSSWIWIVVLCLLSLSLSASVCNFQLMLVACVSRCKRALAALNKALL